MKRLVWLLTLAIFLAGTSPVRADVIYNNGAVNNLSNNLNDNAIVQDSPTVQATTLNMLSGGVANNMTVRGASVLNMTGNAYIVNTLTTYGSSTTFVNSYYIDQSFANVALHDSSKVTIGNVINMADTFSADGSSTLIIGESEGVSLTAAGNSTVIVDSYNSHGSIVASGNSTMSLNDTHFTEGGLSVLDSANVSLYGADSRFLNTFNVSVSGMGKLTVYGTNFNYGPGELTDDTGTLTGTLADGETISMNFTGGHNIFLVETPEPSTLVLAGLGLVSLAGYSWRCAPRRNNGAFGR